MRKEFYANPERVTTAYMEKVRLELGMTSFTQYFHMWDMTRRNQARFGRMKRMLRIYGIFGEVLDHISHGRTCVASALLCQKRQKSVLQMAIDPGSWDIVKLL